MYQLRKCLKFTSYQATNTITLDPEKFRNLSIPYEGNSEEEFLKYIDENSYDLEDIYEEMDEEVEEIRNNISKPDGEPKPYAILEKEFRNLVIEYRNLPNHDELREYLQFNRHISELTIDQIEENFGTQAPHHWFEKNGSYPSKEDWINLKQMLLLDDKYDKAMTEVFYKSGIKCDNNYIDNGLVKQCKCETNETKSGIVFDPFMGSGTTAQVAKELGRQYMGCELNPEYKKLQDERLK